MVALPTLQVVPCDLALQHSLDFSFFARRGLQGEGKRAQDTARVKVVRSAYARVCAYLCARWHAAPGRVAGVVASIRHAREGENNAEGQGCFVKEG